jgi:hypothetical protein
MFTSALLRTHSDAAAAAVQLGATPPESVWTIDGGLSLHEAPAAPAHIATTPISMQARARKHALKHTQTRAHTHAQAQPHTK